MDSQWLKTQFDVNPAKTKAGLASAIGLTPPAVSKILAGTRQIKAQEYIQMRQYFGLPSDGHAAVKAPAGSPVPVQSVLNDEGSKTTADDWMRPVKILSPNMQGPGEKTRIFKVQEDVMEPEFSIGDHVLVDITDRNPVPPGVFIVSDGFGKMPRHCELVKKTSPAEVKISARGGKFQTQNLRIEDFMIVGRVIAKLQMI